MTSFLDRFPHAILVEASQLGWLPGEWPFLCTYNGLFYHKVAYNHEDGDLIEVLYSDVPLSRFAVDGCDNLLVVAND